MYNFSLFLNFLVIQIDFKITKKLLTAILGKKKGKPQANQTITKEDTSIMISLIPKKKSCTEVNKLHHTSDKINDSTNLNLEPVNKNSSLELIKLNIPHTFLNTRKR